MTFGDVLEAMKRDGACAARHGWNGKGMYICLAKGVFDGPARGFAENSTVTYPHQSLQDGVSFGLFDAGADGTVTRMPHFVMRTASGAMLDGWLASQTDMLAEDWELIY